MAGPPEHFVVFGRKIPRTPNSPVFPAFRYTAEALLAVRHLW